MEKEKSVIDVLKNLNKNLENGGYEIIEVKETISYVISEIETIKECLIKLTGDLK